MLNLEIKLCRFMILQMAPKIKSYSISEKKKRKKTNSYLEEVAKDCSRVKRKYVIKHNNR